MSGVKSPMERGGVRDDWFTDFSQSKLSLFHLYRRKCAAPWHRETCGQSDTHSYSHNHQTVERIRPSLCIANP